MEAEISGQHFTLCLLAKCLVADPQYWKFVSDPEVTIGGYFPKDVEASWR